MNDWWVSSRHTEHQNTKQACQKITFPSKGSILTWFSFIFFTISNILFKRTFFERKSKHITKILIKRGNFEGISLFLYSFFIPPYDPQMHQKLYHKCETWNKYFSCSEYLKRHIETIQRNDFKCNLCPKLLNNLGRHTFVRKSWFSINIDRYPFGCE